MAALPSRANAGATRSISSAEYALLVARNLGGVAPVVAPAPAPRIAKHARTWQCAHFSLASWHQFAGDVHGVFLRAIRIRAGLGGPPGSPKVG